MDEISWMFPMEQMLLSMRNPEQVKVCSISKVPDKLRKPNEAAYSPQVVSVGPLHKGTRSDLVLMEHPKWSYMMSLFERSLIPKETDLDADKQLLTVLNRCGSTVMALDNIVRASYGGNMEAEPHELANTMLVDGCFLLEFLLKLQNFRETFWSKNGNISKEDPIFESLEKLLPVLSDLILFENQVPFIVLKKLYRKLFSDGEVSLEDDNRVADLALGALGYPLVLPTSGVAHLLHLVHLSTVNHEDKHEMTTAKKELKRCATVLRSAGITIKAANSSNHGTNHHKHSNLVESFDLMIKFNVVNSKLENSFDFNIKFNDDDGVLEIPSLYIKETTEIKWRNLIAWEQSLTGKPWKLTSYALFFQGLICCEHDIELLVNNRVIVNDCNKSKEDLLKLFRNICVGVEHMDSSYSEQCMKLNEYNNGGELWKKLPIVIWHQCRRIFAIIVFYWKNWYRILIEEQIPTVWKLIGVLAATALLVLTIMQTYYSAHS